MVPSITEQVLLLGMDIGGVNLKCSSVPWKDVNRLDRASSTKHFFPLWTKTVGELREQLASIIAEHLALSNGRIGAVKNITVYPCASITGELSDAFSSKKEGIECITSSLSDATESAQKQYGNIIFKKPRFVAVDGTLRTLPEAVADHRAVSAANWRATAAWVGSFVPNCILVDCGSTTTDIIPIASGNPVPEGLTDIDRLRSGELVYTGILRATIPSVAHVVPVHGEPVPVSFEKFALMADVHLILGNITKEQYDCDTADGRSTSIDDCKRRLARTVCEDAAELGDGVILEIANFLADAQARMIQDGLERVARRFVRSQPCVLTGLGETSMALKAAKQAGFSTMVSLAEKIGTRASTVSSSIGVLHVLATHLKGAGRDGW
jgi:probable H4MPT-linked C1 transfer pathway protein